MAEALKHTYPSNYGPGVHWAIDEAWQILDELPVGQLTDDQRFLVAGRIAGTLLRVASPETRLHGSMLMAGRAAWHALMSYEHGNSSAALSRTVADVLKEALSLHGMECEP